MIKTIKFTNFKALRDTTLPLGQLTILVGPNGSGKSTALDALRPSQLSFKNALSAGVKSDAKPEIVVEIEWGPPFAEARTIARGHNEVPLIKRAHIDKKTRQQLDRKRQPTLNKILNHARIYSFDASVLAQPVALDRKMELGPKGEGLAGVLDRLRDDYPERFEALNEEFGRCLPEFDCILFETPRQGERAIKFRTRTERHAIPANDISQGTLLALAILTLAYLPDPPPILGLEEPGRGIHPRLLRDIKDAMYRLAYPDSFGEKREAVQVVATTHSPYMLDLFRDHPEEIVIAGKVEGNVRFDRLSDLPNISEILSDAPLGEVWYSGILGGVPA